MPQGAPAARSHRMYLEMPCMAWAANIIQAAEYSTHVGQYIQQHQRCIWLVLSAKRSTEIAIMTGDC